MKVVYRSVILRILCEHPQIDIFCLCDNNPASSIQNCVNIHRRYTTQLKIKFKQTHINLTKTPIQKYCNFKRHFRATIYIDIRKSIKKNRNNKPEKFFKRKFKERTSDFFWRKLASKRVEKSHKSVCMWAPNLIKYLIT